jgi:thiamine biosynthesis protein ThiS
LKVLLNGESHETTSSNVLALIEELELDRQWVVVELNLTVPEKSLWETTAIGEGDQIEIVRFLGGG